MGGGWSSNVDSVVQMNRYGDLRAAAFFPGVCTSESLRSPLHGLMLVQRDCDCVCGNALCTNASLLGSVANADCGLRCG